MDLYDLSAATSSAPSDSYQYFRVINGEADPGLIEDLQGIEIARWFVSQVRRDFEDASFGSKVSGTLGSFDGVISDHMPGYWKKADSGMWQPDTRHPLGRWLMDTIRRLVAMPPPEILDDVLRRYGIEGSRELLPSFYVAENDFALAISSPKKKSFSVKGVIKEDSLRHLWIRKA